MKIEAISLTNYKAFREATMTGIPRMCVVVGANGTGKSTLFDVFGFLKDAMTENVQKALSKRGGFKEVRSRDAEGPIEIEMKFRETSKSPLITYYLSINEKDGKPYVQREILKYRRGSRGQPWHFLDFTDGSGAAVTNELDSVQDESELVREQQARYSGHQGAGSISTISSGYGFWTVNRKMAHIGFPYQQRPTNTDGRICRASIPRG
jgi:predicted ATPase